MSNLKRDIEAIYVLEPWYSKMRQELKDTGWVADNVFWERVKRSLNTFTDRVIETVAGVMLRYLWWGDQSPSKMPVRDYMVWYAEEYWRWVFGDKGITFLNLQTDKRVSPKELLNAFPKKASLLFVDVPVRSIMAKFVDSMIHGRGYYWGVDETSARAIKKILVPYFSKEYKQLHRYGTTFPYATTMSNAVRHHIPDANEGDYRFAKVLDRLNAASMSTNLPKRLIAINVAINAVHNDARVNDMLPGIGYSDLTRWSRMGILPVGRAKQYLESLLPKAVDMLLEGQHTNKAIAMLVGERWA